MISAHSLSRTYRQAHDTMRNCDGLQPQEAFEELLKFLFVVESGDIAQLSSAQLRRLFKDSVKNNSDWLTEYWKDKDFHLSDVALGKLKELFSGVDFQAIDLDIRSAALREFLSPEIRRGLGIYLTPDNVVRMMLDVATPEPGSRIYDPACGSGTFLIEAVRALSNGNGKGRRDVQVWGSDKSARMLTLALLNLGGMSRLVFNNQVADALATKQSSWPRDGFFDYIFTNPPFGVTVDNQTTDFSRYKTCSSVQNGKKVQSEVLFIERCLNLLRPGGTLGIVLPKSVVTNTALENARQVIDAVAYVSACIILPPETFHTAGTQTNTVVLFLKKYSSREDMDESVRIPLLEVSNVGYDSTGRYREGDQLPLVADILAGKKTASLEGPEKILLPSVPKKATLASLGQLVISAGSRHRGKASGTRRLGDVATLVCTGRTPGRSAYTDSGIFLVKVGNLSGHGIDWTPRDRNFVGSVSARTAMLQKDDILMTSSAHSPNYIAKKCDIISVIPDSVGGRASFVGEVMLVRPNSKEVNPLLLLGFLRLPETIARIQRMVRGQTAHLNAGDLMELDLPAELFRPSKDTRALEANLLEESRLVDMLSALIVEQRKLADEVFQGKSRKVRGGEASSAPVPVLS